MLIIDTRDDFIHCMKAVTYAMELFKFYCAQQEKDIKDFPEDEWFGYDVTWDVNLFSEDIYPETQELLEEEMSSFTRTCYVTLYENSEKAKEILGTSKYDTFIRLDKKEFIIRKGNTNG